MKRLTKAQIQSNRNHHLTYWDDAYKGCQAEMTQLVMECGIIIDKFNKLHDEMKAIDANRRENAVLMGVHISESDKTYDFTPLMESIPSVIKHMKKMFGRYGIDPYEEMKRDTK